MQHLVLEIFVIREGYYAVNALYEVCRVCCQPKGVGHVMDGLSDRVGNVRRTV